MPLPIIDFPAGMFKNGTPYATRGRWTDGNHIRWHDGAIRPIGGWERRAYGGVSVNAIIPDPTAEAVRGAIAYLDNTGIKHLVFTSNLSVTHVGLDGTITDITPSGYTAINSSKDTIVQSSYGYGVYGYGIYGRTNDLSGADSVHPDRWYTATYGEILIYGSVNNGAMYELDPTALTDSLVTNAPSDVSDICVTEERQVFAVATDGEPRRVRISDIENRTDWTPTAANQAIDRVLSGTGKLLRCSPLLGSVFILSEDDAQVAKYIGPPYIYSIKQVGTSCGPISPMSMITSDRFAVWWGDGKFWQFDGTLTSLRCDVIDFLTDDVDFDQAPKITAMTITNFSEIMWLYQRIDSTTGEVDSYVVWNYVDGHWRTGRLDRTVGIDKGVLNHPVMVTSDGLLYNHERNKVLPADEGDVFVETGTIDIGNGDRNVAIQRIYPDTQSLGDLTYTLTMTQMPNNTETSYGPYVQRSPTPVRALGRSMRMRVDFLDRFSELGITRYEIAKSGTGSR